MTKQEKLELAHRMLAATQSEVWLDTILPYLKGEMEMNAELMAFQTEPLQLMRYAGAMQALRSIILVDQQSKKVIDESMKKTLKEFSD